MPRKIISVNLLTQFAQNFAAKPYKKAFWLLFLEKVTSFFLCNFLMNPNLFWNYTHAKKKAEPLDLPCVILKHIKKLRNQYLPLTFVFDNKNLNGFSFGVATVFNSYLNFYLFSFLYVNVVRIKVDFIF